MPYYATVQEVRNLLKTQTSEWSDTALQQFIEKATLEIEDATSRTWQAPITLTDYYYDGDGTDILYLDHTDIQSLSSIAIQSAGGLSTTTYTSVTTSKVAVYEAGFLVLYTDAEQPIFTAGPKSIKLTYVSGAAHQTALDDVTNINTTDTAIVADSTVGFPETGYIIIGSEWIHYISKTSTTFTADTRGALGTTAAIHLDNAIINEAAPDHIRLCCILLIAYYMNGDEQKRIQAYRMLNNDIWKGPLVV